MKTIFEMMSLHCDPCILYSVKVEWKFYIQTYCHIVWVDFANTVAIIFYPSGRPHLTNHPLPLSAFVHFSLTPSPPPSPLYVQTSFMDGPLYFKDKQNNQVCNTEFVFPLISYFENCHFLNFVVNFCLGQNASISQSFDNGLITIKLTHCSRRLLLPNMPTRNKLIEKSLHRRHVIFRL